jgi:glycosyltransferase involved in cell wall biosynthesis
LDKHLKKKGREYKMKFLWLTWKDYTHPQAGGAEVVLRELSKRLVAEGHQVTFLTVRHPGSAKREIMDGIEIIRVGTNRYAHPFQALAYYLKHMRNQYDVIVEVVNTVPYFSTLFKGKAKPILFYHQLAREVWFYETKSPLNRVGYYLIEPMATWIMSRAKAKLITVSQSTLTDLQRFGFRPEKAEIISEGIEIKPTENLEAVEKFEAPTMLSLGAMRPMKRTIDQVKAFELAKKSIPGLKLILAGDYRNEYGRYIMSYARHSPYSKDISFEGRVSRDRKQELMQRSHVVTMTSVKEGWGLIVTEAASQGTPTVVYDVDGLRDSVRNQETGHVCAPNPESMADSLASLLEDQNRYRKLRKSAWEWSKQITFDKSYTDFKSALRS